MNDNKLYALLAWAGVLPFAACALALIAGLPEIAALGSWPEVAATYGLAIAAFMAGVHWGIYLQQSTPLNLLFTSNAITVGVWLGFVVASTVISLAITAVAFVLLLLVDSRLANAGVMTPAYLRLRRNVTVVVVALLLITLLLA